MLHATLTIRRLPITFENKLDTDKDQKNVGHDLYPNLLSLW